MPKNFRWQQGSQLPHPVERQPTQASRTWCAQKLDQMTVGRDRCWLNTARPPRSSRHQPVSEIGEGATRRICGLRRKLIGLLRNGSEHFTPEEVCRIVQTARIVIKGSLNAINMLDKDMRHFEKMSPKSGQRKLREQCQETVQEYEESMLVWKEMKDTG